MLIRYSGLSLEKTANIIDVSKRWLQYVKKKTHDFDIPTIEKFCAFFNVDFITLTTSKLNLKPDYRSLLQKHHKSNLEYNKILSETPSIPYAIEFILTTDVNFIKSEGMEIKEIRNILEKHNLSYNGSSLSNELRKSEFIEYWDHPTKKNTYLYRIKKQDDKA